MIERSECHKDHRDHDQHDRDDDQQLDQSLSASTATHQLFVACQKRSEQKIDRSAVARHPPSWSFGAALVPRLAGRFTGFDFLPGFFNSLLSRLSTRPMNRHASLHSFPLLLQFCILRFLSIPHPAARDRRKCWPGLDGPFRRGRPMGNFEEFWGIPSRPRTQTRSTGGPERNARSIRQGGVARREHFSRNTPHFRSKNQQFFVRRCCACANSTCSRRPEQRWISQYRSARRTADGCPEPTHIHPLVSWRHQRGWLSVRNSLKSSLSKKLKELDPFTASLPRRKLRARYSPETSLIA